VLRGCRRRSVILVFAAAAGCVAELLSDMIVETDNCLTFEVNFSISNREEGCNDDN
jgi:hypothetical protein